MATNDKNEHRRTQAQVANDGSDAPTDANVHGAGVQQQGAHKLTKPRAAKATTAATTATT